MWKTFATPDAAMPRIFSRFDTGSFPDAEPVEDPVEDVVGDDGADDLAELVDGLTQVDGDELVAAVEEQGLRRRTERLAGSGEALAAACPGGGGEVAVGGAAAEGPGDGEAERREP